MIAHAHLLYGTNEEARTSFINTMLEKLSPEFSHTFGKEKPIGIDDAHEIRRRAYLASRDGTQVFFIWQADSMTPEAYEALLKLLEEPPRGAYFFLCALSNVIPETLQSRVRQVSFYKREGEHVEEGDEDSAFFNAEISCLKESIETHIRSKNIVPVRDLHKLKAAMQLSTMRRATRINPRYIIEAYKLIP